MYSSKSCSIIDGILFFIELDEFSIEVMAKIDNNTVNGVQFPEDVRNNRMTLEGGSRWKLIE